MPGFTAASGISIDLNMGLLSVCAHVFGGPAIDADALCTWFQLQAQAHVHAAPVMNKFASSCGLLLC
jgi:hypothetical protein